jgi:hypothetical protein
MLIRKTSADYIDDLHRRVKEHYGIIICKDRMIAVVNCTIINSFTL